MALLVHGQFSRKQFRPFPRRFLLVFPIELSVSHTSGRAKGRRLRATLEVGTRTIVSLSTIIGLSARELADLSRGP